jgi:hypothetical protein
MVWLWMPFALTMVFRDVVRLASGPNGPLPLAFQL